MSRPPLYRVRLQLQAPLGTPLVSGTLFGHLCWALLEDAGTAVLENWLDAQDETPWLVSDGFLPGLLPRPLLPRAPRQQATSVAAADRAKAAAKRAWITADGFIERRGALSDAALDQILTDVPATRLGAVRSAHNTIDRITGSTPESGGLYFVDEDWRHVDQPYRDVYVRTASPAGEIERLFTLVGRAGYGRDATYGRGCFVVADVTPVPALDDGGGPYWLSLSHGTITDGMDDARYKLMTHFGKVGAGMAATGIRPWKKPILLTRPGLTFRAGSDGPFGALLAGVHPDRPEIRHDARHVAIPFSPAPNWGQR